MSAPTPGSWKVGASPFTVWCGETQIASCLWRDGGDLSHFARECASYQDAQAHALLIAAAPDMLDALQFVDTYLGFLPGDVIGDTADASLARIVRAALAKAGIV